jgi:hypothetical protein
VLSKLEEPASKLQHNFVEERSANERGKQFVCLMDAPLRNPPEVKVQSELLCDQNLKYIPIIVNGQVNETKKDRETSTNNSKWNYLCNSLNDSMVKLSETKAKYLEGCKHEVLIMGDSHMRGRASRLITSLDARFDVCDIVKPGSDSGSLTETMKDEIRNFTKNDFLIICSC